MRELKFRAWHKKGKMMFSAENMGQDQLTLSVDGRGFINVSGDSTELSEFITDMLPMQYTGLKDKNGKDIYEGDILKKENLKAKVFWDDTDLAFKAISNDGDKYGPYYMDLKSNSEHNKKEIKKIEIIGNIHENPELLK